LLAGLVDEVIFCDCRRFTVAPAGTSRDNLPATRFLQGDVREVIHNLPPIDVLFYRNDSTGEGGSGVFILGKQWLKAILDRFSPAGGLIITDGSNSGEGLFRKMIRAQGYTRQSWGWRFQPTQAQNWLQTHHLHTIEVTKITQ